MIAKWHNGAESREMARAGNWVMVRRPGCVPYTLFAKEWDALPSTDDTDPSEQAVTEAMVEAALEKFEKIFASSMQYPSERDTVGSIRHHIMRAALKAAMEAGR